MQKRSEGGYFLQLCNLTTELKYFPNTSYKEYVQNFNRSEFYKLLPDNNNRLPAYAAPRSQPLRLRGEPIFQQAHLIPQARSCNRNWIPLFSPMFDEPACQIKPADLAAAYFVYGVAVNESKEPNTGFLSNRRNFIHWAHQQHFLDDNPRIVFVPFVNSSSDYFSSRPNYKILVFCSDDSVCVRTLVPMIAKKSNERDCSDPEVRAAVSVFNEVLVNVMGHLKEQEVEHNSTRHYQSKSEVSAEFRKFLRSQSGVYCPKLPDSGKVAVVELGEDSDFGNPHPFVLALKAINSWFNFLHRSNQMPEWVAFYSKIAKLSKLLRKGTPVVSMLACRDHAGGLQSCLLCKCNEMFTAPFRFVDLDSDILELARAYLDGVESLDDTEVDQLEKVKMWDEDVADFEYSEDCAGVLPLNPAFMI